MKSDAGSSTGTAITGVICGTTTASVEIGGRKRSQYVTRYMIRHGTDLCCCASRIAPASASSLFASQTGSTTSLQNVSAFSSRGCRKNAYVRNCFTFPGLSYGSSAPVMPLALPLVYEGCGCTYVMLSSRLFEIGCPAPEDTFGTML